MFVDGALKKEILTNREIHYDIRHFRRPTSDLPNGFLVFNALTWKHVYSDCACVYINAKRLRAYKFRSIKIANEGTSTVTTRSGPGAYKYFTTVANKLVQYTKYVGDFKSRGTQIDRVLSSPPSFSYLQSAG